MKRGDLKTFYWWPLKDLKDHGWQQFDNDGNYEEVLWNFDNSLDVGMAILEFRNGKKGAFLSYPPPQKLSNNEKATRINRVRDSIKDIVLKNWTVDTLEAVRQLIIARENDEEEEPYILDLEAIMNERK
jgi:hypothetical protein